MVKLIKHYVETYKCNIDAIIKFDEYNLLGGKETLTAPFGPKDGEEPATIETIKDIKDWLQTLAETNTEELQAMSAELTGFDLVMNESTDTNNNNSGTSIENYTPSGGRRKKSTRRFRRYTRRR